MKKMGLILVFLLLAGVPGLMAQAGLTGDANNSGAVDVVDALLVARYAAGLSVSLNTALADTDCSGNIDVLDALNIARYSAGLLNQLCTPATPVPTPSPTAVAGPVIVTPPGWVHTFYKKCVMIYGLCILTSEKVPDQALFNAYYVLDAFLKKIAAERQDILQEMIANRARLTIVGLTEVNADLPEWAGYNPTERRGGGGLNCTVLEEDCIVPPTDTWRQNFCGIVHEFAHTTLSYGIGDAGNVGADMELYQKIRTAYNNAIARNLYTESSYDRNNYHEYFTGQACRWFNGNPTNLNVPNARNLTDRQQLEIYDPEIYAILATIFGDYKLPAPWN